MAVDGITSPSHGGSVDGDGTEDEDADLLPLSSIFSVRGLEKGLSEGKRSRMKPPITAAVGDVGAPEGGRNLRKGRGLLEEGHNGGSPCGRRGSFANGDLVWAKAFPYTWWPGWVRESRGLVRLVSFFGGDRPQWRAESRIRGFEENYVRMSKMAGARLACEVDCALAELGRRTALGMACSCRGVVGVADEHLVTQTSRERERFEPAEMLEFVLNLAVCAWVDDGQTICAVRVAAQVNAYRLHVSGARTDEVNGGFQPAETFDAIRCLAVSAWVDDEAVACMARVVAHIDAYRHFVSKRPDWVYQNPVEEGDISTSCSTGEDSEGSDLEMPFISLSETAEAENPDSFYENDIEEWDEKDSMMQEEMQPDGKVCKINRIDYSILSDMEFGQLSDNKMENVFNWSGEKGVACDTEETREVSTLNEGRHNWICNLIRGLISSDSGQEFSLGRETFERDQDNEVNVANAVSGDVELLFNNNFDKSRVFIDSTDGSTNMSNSSCRYASHLDRFHEKEFDQTVAPDSSVEMHKAADFSLTDASTSCSLECRTENSSQFFTDVSLKPQSMVAGMSHGEEGCLQFFHEMLYYLYCLASDPLHMRSDSLLPFCQLVLSYRASIFQNISSLPSIIWTEESQKAQELDVWGHHHLTNESGEKYQDDKFADMCEYSSIAEVLFHAHDDGIELQSSAECHSNLHMPHAARDYFTIHSSADVSTASKTVEKNDNDGIKCQFNVERRLSGKVVVDKRYTAAGGVVVKGVSHLTFRASRDCEVVTQKRRFDQEVTSATFSNLHAANCLGSDVKPSSMSMILLENKRSNDRKAFYINRSDMNDETEVLFQDNAGHDVVTVQSSSNFSAAASTSGDNIESTAVACSSALPPTCRYESSSCRKRRLDHPVHSYISKWQKNSPFTSATKLYASPLVKDSSSATNRAQCTPIIGRRTGPSNSLHMKFPRGFKLPSKEDLEKIFRVFGPLDRSSTRVFFYTGAGKVVFLNPVDAETAYNYVRRNRVFETGMRFWLDAHEKLRKGYSTQALSLSGEQMPALSLKSCLRTSSVHENEDVKKKCRVRFSM